MELGSKWLVHTAAPLALAPDRVGVVLIVSHVEKDGRVWLSLNEQGRCNTPEWWARFVSPVREG